MPGVISPRQSSSQHLGIHGLRGACVLAIFLYHVVNSGLLPQAHTGFWAVLRWLCDGLRYGVEVFFMISGYVIVQSLRRHANVTMFFRDRVLRIFPLWIPLACAMLFSTAVWAHFSGAQLRALPSTLTLIPSLLILAPVLPVTTIHPAQWSLCYELFFYGFAAATWANRSEACWRWLCCLLPAAVFAILFPRALFFAPGVLLALCEPQLRARASWFRWAWIGLPAAWIAWLQTGAEDASLSRTLFDFLVQGHGASVLIAMAGATLFFGWLLLFRERGEGALGTRAMQWLGTISFSFYLVHPIVMGGVKRVLLPALQLQGWSAVMAFSLISFIVACFLSHLTWRFLEVGLRRWLLSLGGKNLASVLPR